MKFADTGSGCAGGGRDGKNALSSLKSSLSGPVNVLRICDLRGPAIVRSFRTAAPSRPEAIGDAIPRGEDQSFVSQDVLEGRVWRSHLSKSIRRKCRIRKSLHLVPTFEALACRCSDSGKICQTVTQQLMFITHQSIT